MTQNSKILDKKNQKGLSLIESAMVLALAATVTAGVMFYYQSASDSNKTQAAISEVMSATSAINGLYVGQPNYTGLKADVLLNSSAIPDNYKDTSGNGKITNPFGGELKVEAPATGNQYGYSLTLTGLPKSACISLGTLNLGTSAAGYAISANGTPSFPGSGGNGPISPATAATKCTSDSNSVAYFMK